MELWDLYTKQRQLVGKDHIRGKKIPDGYYHLVVHIWIHNGNGKYLIAQRSSSCARLPLMWECIGGSVLKGEDSLSGALREVNEEVGIILSPNKGRMLRSEVREYFHDIRDIWLFEYNGPVCLDRAATNEVAQVKWMDKNQIKKIFEEGLMPNDLQYFLRNFLVNKS